MIRRVALALGLAFGVLDCNPTGEQVPLNTVEGQECCSLMSSVVDVVARPAEGNVAVTDLRWPAGFTAWQLGKEIEIRSTSGAVVLRTPGRFRIIPTFPDLVVGRVEPCSSCELGSVP